MTEQQNVRLRQSIRDLAERARKLREQYSDPGLGEENTKASLIDPMLEALGWDIRNPDEVFREFRPNPRDNPVDYCLRLMRNTRLLIEAKGLGEDLKDRRWIAQILGYATMAGAEWCVLTDGDQYRLYNATAAVDADGKLFRQIHLASSQEDEAAGVLSLISRGNMEENRLSVLWSAYFVDRRVKQALRFMLDSTDRKLVRLIRNHTPDLAPKEVIESLRRLVIQIELPTVPPEMTAPAAKRPVPGNAPKKRRKAERRQTPSGGGTSVTLADVITANLLMPPVPLFRKYKGQQIEATLLPDGKVEFQGTRYDSGSTAAEFARVRSRAGE
jgi:predicted type IV restriction endonuclease